MRRRAISTFAATTAFASLLAIRIGCAGAQSLPGYWAGDVARRPYQNLAAADHAQRVLDYYGNESARATLNQMPQRTPIQPAMSGQMPHHGKPFHTATTTPTVSPYLNLFRDDDEVTQSAPSYYAFVRPQIEQQETNERQQRELQRLERQVQRRPSGPTPGYSPGGSVARFMDTAQFYGGWRR